MSININIIEQQFANQFNNGEDLNSDLTPLNTTSFLNGNAGELLSNKITFAISWSAESTPLTDIFSVNGNTLTRSGSGDFESDGFKLGDLIDGWELTPLSAIFQDREILTISSSQISFDGVAVASYTFTSGKIYGKTPLENIIFNYGLIENNDTISFISRIDATAENEFFASGVGVDTGGGVRDTSFVSMSKATGVNSWKTDGNAEIKFVSTGNQTDNFKQTFDIIHIFRLLPYYLDGWLTNLQTLSPPFPEWQSGNCLKYVSRIEMRETMSNPNSSRSEEFDSVQGNTGWIDENFNGFTNNFSVQSIDITSNLTGTTLTALDYQESCHVVITLFSNNNVFAGDDVKVLGLISFLPDASDYQQNQQTINENFLLDSIYTTIAESPKTSSILKNFDITSVSGTGDTCVVEFDVEYSSSQQLNLQNKKYMILMGTCDGSLLSPASDRVMLLADLNDYEFNLDVPDLMFMDEFKFVPHDLNETSLILPNSYNGWIEDGFQIQTPFKLNTDLGAVLSSLSVDIVAFNTDTNQEFTIQTNIIDLSGSVVSLGVQQINVNNLNNFLLDNTSDFKKIFCENIGAGVHGVYNIEYYDTKIGVRFNFEEWIPLLSANTQYFDPSQLNNGLNLLTSNYSTTNTFSPPDNFQIKAKLNANVLDSNGVSTNYIFISNDLKAFFYDEDGNKPAKWVCNIQTYDTTGFLIDNILNDNFTDVKATFTKNSPLPPADLINAWGWIRLDVTQGTINTPFEISTIYNPITSSALIPLPTESKCKITNNGNDVILECRIDNNLIPSGSQLSISARIGGQTTETFTTWKIQECGESPTPQIYYTLTDLTSYIGKIVLFENAECWEVIGEDTKAPDVPFSTIVNDDFSDCVECNLGIKKMDGTSPVGNIIKTTEQGNIKTLE